MGLSFSFSLFPFYLVYLVDFHLVFVINVLVGIFELLFLNYLFIYLLICQLPCVSVDVYGLSLVAVSGGYSSSECPGLSLRWFPCGARAPEHAGSEVVVYGLSCSVACEIFLNQGLNPCPLHWQENS